MGKRLQQLAGALIIGAGLFVMFGPLVSVLRVSGQVLDELPAIEGTSIDDRRGFSALSDDDFTLATRTYVDRELEVVRSAYVAAGFETWGSGASSVLAKECCGDYDAVAVSLRVPEGSGDVVATVTTVDGDSQSAVFVLGVIGLGVVILGLGVVRGASRGDDQVGPDPRTPTTH